MTHLQINHTQNKSNKRVRCICKNNEIAETCPPQLPVPRTPILLPAAPEGAHCGAELRSEVGGGGDAGQAHVRIVYQHSHRPQVQGTAHEVWTHPQQRAQRQAGGAANLHAAPSPSN